MANRISIVFLTPVFLLFLLTTQSVVANSVQRSSTHRKPAESSDRSPDVVRSTCRSISDDAVRGHLNQMSWASVSKHHGLLPAYCVYRAQDAESASAVVSETQVQSTFLPVFPDVSGKSDSETKDKENQSSAPVTAKVFPQFDRLERGGRCLLAVELSIDEHWHINANPANPDFLVPTKVDVLSEQKVRVKSVLYPKHKLLRVNGADQPYHVYGGRTTIYVQLETDSAETAEVGVLQVRVTCQACNQDTCMPPSEVNLEGKLLFANPGEQIRRINDEKFMELRKKRPKTEEKISAP